MKRALIVGSWLLLAAGCEKSAEQRQNEAEQAQREANEKSAQAQNEAAQKAREAQREADEKSARVNAKADQKSAEEQAKANETVRNVHEDLLKDRNDFQVEAHKAVDEADNRIDTLKVRAAKASAKARADFDVAMKDVEQKRAAVAADLARLESQSAQTFDAFRARTNKELDDFKKAVDAAGSKL